MTAPSSARSVASTSRAWLDRRFLARVDAVLGELAADRVPATRVLVVGDAPAALLDGLRDRFGPAVSTDPASGDVDLVVAVGALGAATDPVARLRELDALTSKHVLVLEPRAPFARGPVTSWTMPALQRLVSEVMSVRQVATPLPWTILWAVRV